MKQTGPLQNLFNDIKTIVSETVFLNGELAQENETQSSASKAELYKAAQLANDTYVTYKKWWTKSMFQSVMYNIKTTEYNYYVANPYSVPLKYREALLEKGRQAFLNSYVEENDYYRMLIGLPAMDDTDYVYLSETLQKKYVVDNVPVHELSTYNQNRYMTTDEYKEVVSNNPDKKYLQFLGKNKIDLYTARTAKDFDIIRYPIGNTGVNPYLLSEFSKMYKESREYIMVVLYNYQMEENYVGYRSFMGFLILAYAMMRTCNRAVEAVSNHKYLDDTIIYIILSMYGIPDSLILTNEARRNLAIHILQLVKEKGTSNVYYDLADILGYTDIVISKLMLMKGQVFGDDGEALDKYDPYFLQLDIKDENPYETIAKGNAIKHSYHDIIDNDPTWWDGEEVQKILQTKKYSEADSKYIMIESTIHMIKSMFEIIYFSRMIIDNPETDDFTITIPSVLGTEAVSIYDCVVFLICAACMNNSLSGEIYTDSEKLLATAGFNFDIDMDSFMKFIDNSEHLDKDRIKSYMSNMSINSESDITRLYSEVMYPMREWLEDKIARTDTREEYVEYEAVYRALYSYDITRNRILDSFELPMETIRKKYELTSSAIEALKYFYPHTSSGAVTVNDFNESTNNTKYHYPFLSLTNPVDWYLHVVIEENGKQYDRGYLYLWDILNSDDVRTIRNDKGDFIFMDYEDEETGWTLNSKVVEQVLYLIDHLEDDDLNGAYFQIYTEKSDGSYYEANEKLPATVRTSVFKSILSDKVSMDTAGLAQQPSTYFEFLQRKNSSLYDILTKDDRFNKNKDAWLNDIMNIVTSVESELSLHLKYIEESTVGKDLFFKPLITLIKHFKSLLVDIVKTDVKYVFDSKMDIAGTSNMMKLFDDLKLTIHFTTVANSGYDAAFGLYDAIHSTNHKLTLKDRAMIIESLIGEGFAAELHKTKMGSMRMSDEAKFYLNGKPIDSDEGSMWYSGDPGSGRWSEDDDVLMRVRTENARVINAPVDTEYWKELVPSYHG